MFATITLSAVCDVNGSTFTGGLSTGDRPVSGTYAAIVNSATGVI